MEAVFYLSNPQISYLLSTAIIPLLILGCGKKKNTTATTSEGHKPETTKIHTAKLETTRTGKLDTATLHGNTNPTQLSVMPTQQSNVSVAPPTSVSRAATSRQGSVRTDKVFVPTALPESEMRPETEYTTLHPTQRSEMTALPTAPASVIDQTLPRTEKSNRPFQMKQTKAKLQLVPNRVNFETTHNGTESLHEIKNTGKVPVAFRITCTNSRTYRVSPAKGICAPKENVLLRVELFGYQSNHKEKVVIQFAEADYADSDPLKVLKNSPNFQLEMNLTTPTA